jgi:O-antigen/teichoic acid export membrane protein
MADSEHFPTRYRELIAVSTIMIALSIFFTTWRVLVRCKVSRWMAWSDWLMILGAVCIMGKRTILD